MANYYVDLDDDSNPGSVGSAADPYGRDEFIAGIVGGGGNTYYLRGMNTLAADVIEGGTNNYAAWDVDLYGPWRLFSTAFTIVFNGINAVSDGILEILFSGGGAGITPTRCYLRNRGAQRVPIHGNTTNCTIVSTPGAWSVAIGNIDNCVFQNGTVTCVAASTFIDNVNVNANFAAFAIPAVGVPVDGGGQIYGATFPTLPAWDEADLSRFNLFPTHGVGASGAWAEPRPMYTDIRIANDGTLPRTGNPDLPATLADFIAHTSPVATRTYKMGGSRVLAAPIIPVYAPDAQTFDGFDLADPTKPEAWIVDGYGNQMSFAQIDGDNIIFKRLALRQGTIAFNTPIDNMRHYFKNCYFRHPTVINLNAGNPVNYYFYGCTFYSPVIFAHYCGNDFYHFRNCLFVNAVVDTDTLINMSFDHCRFTEKSQAEVTAGIQGAYTMTDCEFSAVITRNPPEVVDVSNATMNFFMYGLPLVTDQGAVWTADDYDYGFSAAPRLGVGAFYFDPPTPSFSWTPASGQAPLKVTFYDTTGSAFEATGYHWEFGDGEGSDEDSPSHQYLMPGEYYPSMTVTYLGGYTVTHYSTTPVYVYDFDYSQGEPLPTKTDTCYRTPVKAGDGYGVSEYKDGETTGLDWLWPAARVGTCICYDKQNREVALVWDAKTQQIYQINNPRIWQDRVGSYGGGKTIISEIHHKADVAVQGEHVAIVHNEHHNYFKPYDRTKLNTTGYDDKGYPSGMRVDQQVHTDEEPFVFAAETKRIPKDGDIVFQQPIEARSIQIRSRIWGAPWWNTGFNADLQTIDKAARPSLREMEEEDLQEQLTSMPLFHIGRHYVNAMNFATGRVATGTVTSRITGPDGLDLSAMSFAAGSSGLADTLPAAVDGDCTALVWYKDAPLASLPVTLWLIGAAFVTIQNVAGQRTLRLTYGVTVLDVPLNGNGLTWTLITIMREGLNLKVYENDSLLHTAAMPSVINLGLMVNQCGAGGYSIFEPCLLPRAVSQDALTYYVSDVNRGGNEVLRIY
jgi:PKD repeat protein